VSDINPVAAREEMVLGEHILECKGNVSFASGRSPGLRKYRQGKDKAYKEGQDEPPSNH
jgi:hypothetical protein